MDKLFVRIGGLCETINQGLCPNYCGLPTKTQQLNVYRRKANLARLHQPECGRINPSAKCLASSHDFWWIITLHGYTDMYLYQLIDTSTTEFRAATLHALDRRLAVDQHFSITNAWALVWYLLFFTIFEQLPRGDRDYNWTSCFASRNWSDVENPSGFLRCPLHKHAGRFRTTWSGSGWCFRTSQLLDLDTYTKIYLKVSSISSVFDQDIHWPSLTAGSMELFFCFRNMRFAA